VKPGENLFRISQAYATNYHELAEINSIKATELRPGQRIFIPGAKSQAKGTGGLRFARRNALERYHPPERMSRVRKEVAVAGTKIAWPLHGRVKISSGYGMRGGNVHDGIDIAAKKGTPIYAADSGRVIYSSRKLRGYGNMIIIKHKGVYSTVYAHNQVNKVDKGEFVDKGDLIGKVGDTGRASGPHLHFEVRKGRRAVNPLPYLPKR
jgi:murein DD-endopeptidase MepM/ murein hydrolase activator NlpD